MTGTTIASIMRIDETTRRVLVIALSMAVALCAGAHAQENRTPDQGSAGRVIANDATSFGHAVKRDSLRVAAACKEGAHRVAVASRAVAHEIAGAAQRGAAETRAALHGGKTAPPVT